MREEDDEGVCMQDDTGCEKRWNKCVFLQTRDRYRQKHRVKGNIKVSRKRKKSNGKEKKRENKAKKEILGIRVQHRLDTCT